MHKHSVDKNNNDNDTGYCIVLASKTDSSFDVYVCYLIHFLEH